MNHLRIVSLLCLVALLALPGTVLAGGPDKGYSAYAEFRVNPTGCRLTRAEVLVSQTRVHTPPGPPTSAVTVELSYAVRSTCAAQGDNLFYYEFHTEGPVTISAGDFAIHSGLQWATLDTTVPVFDEESGSHTNLTVTVRWTATGKAGPQARAANATIEVAAPFPLQYANVNPIEQSVEAGLQKLR